MCITYDYNDYVMSMCVAYDYNVYLVSLCNYTYNYNVYYIGIRRQSKEQIYS